MQRLILIPAIDLTAARAAAGNRATPPLNNCKSISCNNFLQGELRHVPTLMKGLERAFCVYI